MAAAAYLPARLQSRGLKLNPVTTLYYVAPCCFCFLLVSGASRRPARQPAAGPQQPSAHLAQPTPPL